MRKSRFDSTASCGNANLGCMSAGLQSLACNVAVFPAFWFCTVTVNVKMVERKSTCSAFTPRFRKASWKVLTARMSLILGELVLWSPLLAALCAPAQTVGTPRPSFVTKTVLFQHCQKWRKKKKKEKPTVLFTIVKNLVSLVVSKKSF